MITIRVFNQSTGGIVTTGTKVTVITSTGVVSDFTDARGSVDFNLPSGRYEVSVRGKIVYKGSCVGVTSVYV